MEIELYASSTNSLVKIKYFSHFYKLNCACCSTPKINHKISVICFFMMLFQFLLIFKRNGCTKEARGEQSICQQRIQKGNWALYRSYWL